ncbi:MAG: DUF4189 domain-containing protein [Devosiaceae bacterium]
MMKRGLSSLAAALLTISSIGAAALPATTAMAQDGDRFTAIAFSPSTNALGTVYDAVSQEQAEGAALARCAIHADDCESINWSRNACSALAIDVNGQGGWGGAWGSTHEEAALGAHGTCMEFNDSCQVYAWVCNSGSQPN